MALNQLNLFFGPKLPLEFESVGLAFIAAPTLHPDTAIGVLSSTRYAQQNYSHIEDNLNIFDVGTKGAKLVITYDSPTYTAFGSSLGIESISLNGEDTLKNEYWSPVTLNSVLKVAGMYVSPTESWHPVIKPGVVWRSSYVLAASGLEPSGSWLRRAIPDDGTDHKLILIYSVPEVLYTETATGNYGLPFPPQPAKYNRVIEYVNVIEPHVLGFDGNINVLLSLTVNGSSRFSGTFTGVESDTFVKGINSSTKTIQLHQSLLPDDEVIIEYYSFADYYIYSGYRDYVGNWWPFDANPEFGHIIGDDQDEVYRLASDALLKQITLYTIPSAAIEYTFTENVSGSTYLGTLALRAYRGIDYGETHFVRHIISSEPVERIDARDGGTVINTWGFGTFGRNFYDEENQYGGDIFNLTVPSMIPLGRFVLGAPPSVQSVSIADIRQRGGGVPEDYPMVALESTSNGIDTLRGFFDLGIWGGKAIKEGGVVEIRIDSSLLKTDSTDTNPNTFLATEIQEIVENNIAPGIDYEIVYVENL